MGSLGRLLPRGSDFAGLRRSWPGDLVAGVTVGVVALPLALAFGVATGVGAWAGLVTAVVAGAVAAVFGGSHLQVSGPTGAMTVVLVPLVARHGPAVVHPVAVLAGVLVVAAAVLRLGRLRAYVPWPLVEGFTLGIAIVVAARQVPSALGSTSPTRRTRSRPPGFAADPHWAVLGLLALSVVLTAGLPRLHSRLPASLVAVAVVTVVAELSGARLPVVGSLPAGLPVPAVPDLGGAGDLLGAAAVVAFLAALEGLLSAPGGRRHERRVAARPGPRAVRPGAGQRRLRAVRGDARHGGDRPDGGERPARRPHPRRGAHPRARPGRRGLRRGGAGRPHPAGGAGRSAAGDGLPHGGAAHRAGGPDLHAGRRRLPRAGPPGPDGAVPEPLDDGIDAETEQALLAGRVLAYRLDGPLFFAAADRFLGEITATTDMPARVLSATSSSTSNGAGSPSW